ncbi:MAG: methyltransferase [Deltaproteobacteria bacterium]|nr:methyltransferase [Deltaproteobacteria bacterium]
MSLYAEKSSILVTCAREIPPYLREEITSMGFPILSEFTAGIETEGTIEDTIKLNLCIRTGQRVLYLIKELTAHDADELYQEISKIAWENYILKSGYFTVTSFVNNPTIQDSMFANVKCKDAIADRFLNIFGVRPDSGPDRKGIVIYLYWSENRCSVYLDTSGEPLSRRGYRKIPLVAPMQETLAAAIILASGWSGEGNFINPMCGSGTLAIEASLIALNKAPGLLRNNFGFMHMLDFERSAWTKLRNITNRRSKKQFAGKIIATDINPRAIDAARKNAKTAGVEHLIEFHVSDYSDTPVPAGFGVVMLNPEYGERMGEIENLKKTYRGIGDFFKKKCSGYMGYIFTGNLKLAKNVELRTKRKIPFYNSNIECRLLEYELYEGSKKTRR